LVKKEIKQKRSIWFLSSEIALEFEKISILNIIRTRKRVISSLWRVETFWLLSYPVNVDQV
jgi:hypothetical protein